MKNFQAIRLLGRCKYDGKVPQCFLLCISLSCSSSQFVLRILSCRISWFDSRSDISWGYYLRTGPNGRSLRRSSTAARLLRLRVRIPPGAWMSVSCGYCVLSGRGLCDELTTRLEQSYLLWCVFVRDLETSGLRRTRSTGSNCAKYNKRLRSF